MKNNQRHVMVTVHRNRGLFYAYAEMAEAVHPTSATIAAQTAAATHFGLGRERIEVDPVATGVIRATVRDENPKWEAPTWVYVLGGVILGAIFARGLLWLVMLARDMTGGGS